MPLLAVTLPAFHFLEKFMAMPDALDGDRGLRRHFDRLARLLCLPPFREGLDVSDQIVPILAAQRTPRRHIAGLDTAHQCVDQVRVEGQCAGGCGTAFEGRDGEIARLRIDERGCITIAVAVNAMAKDTVPKIESVSTLRVAVESVMGRRIAGADARILGERTTRGRGNEQNREANHSVFHHALSLESEVESSEEAVTALVGKTLRGFHGV